MICGLEINESTMLLIGWQAFMFPNQNYGRFTVLDDGTLVISTVQMEDAGDYVCQGLNVAGSALAKVKLDVRGQLFDYSYSNFMHSFAECGFLTLLCVYIAFDNGT
jgi:Immunoglobulin I-set domain